MNIIGNKEISNIKNKNMSQTKTIANKKKNNPKISSYKIGILDIMNIKKNFAKGFNINDFSKVINCSNLNTKNIFSKTHRTNFSNINK